MKYYVNPEQNKSNDKDNKKLKKKNKKIESIISKKDLNLSESAQILME